MPLSHMRRATRLDQLAIQAAAAALSRGGPHGSLLVLMFHRVLPEPDGLLPDEPDQQRFSTLIELLSKCFRILPLAEAMRLLQSSHIPRRAACITFDDGYANNCDVALPVLAAKGVPATVFVAPGFLDGGRMFNDTVIETVRRAPKYLDLRHLGLGEYRLVDQASRSGAIAALLGQLKYLEPTERLQRIESIVSAAGVNLPDDLMMKSEQVLRLHRAGIEIGAHTVDHPILTSIDDRTAMQQISDSKQRLERIIGSPVTSFAYPNGGPLRDYDGRHVSMVRRAGFSHALSTAWGSATRDCDPFQVPRIASWDRDPLKYGLRLARAYWQRNYQTAPLTTDRTSDLG